MIRCITPKDYPLITKWMASRGIPALDRASLSTLGYIADDMAAGWIYSTDSNVALIEHVVADPQVAPSVRRESVQRLCRFLVEKARSMGFQTIVAISGHPSIERVCEELNFNHYKELKVFLLHGETY